MKITFPLGACDLQPFLRGFSLDSIAPARLARLYWQPETMKKRVLATLAVLLVLAAGLIFYFRRNPAEPPTGPVPELLLLAPSDADSIVYIDLAALRQSPFLTQLLALAPSPNEDPEYREFVSATGFDYARDLDRALIVTRPPSSAASTMAIADGRFDGAKIAAYSLRSGKRVMQNGAEVYVVTSGKPSKTISFTFLAPGRILLTNSAALDLSVASPAQNLPPGQHDRYLRVAGSALILMGRVDASQENFSVFGFRSRDLKGALRDVRWFSLAARPAGDRLLVALDAECISEGAARKLEAAGETLRLLARILLADAGTRRQLSPQAAALAGAILRNGEFIRSDQRVVFRFEITADALAAPNSSDAGRPSSGKNR